MHCFRPKHVCLCFCRLKKQVLMMFWTFLPVNLQRWITQTQMNDIHYSHFGEIFIQKQKVDELLQDTWLLPSVSLQFLHVLNACLQVPSSVFSMCKVLQKKVSQFTTGLFSLNCCWSEQTDFWQQFPLSLQVLILHGNDLRSLVPKGCCTGALTTLKVRDINWAHNHLELLSSANISMCPFLRCWICMKISSHHFLMTSGSYCPCRYSYLLYIKKIDVMDYTHFQKIGVTAFFFFFK